MNRNAQTGIVLLGLYFIASGFGQLGQSIAAISQDSARSFLSYASRLAIAASAGWPIVVFNAFPGLVLILLARPIARRLPASPDEPRSGLSRRDWLHLGAMLIGLLFLTNGVARLAGTIISGVLLLTRTDSEFELIHILPHTGVPLAEAAVGLSLLVLARRVATALGRAA